MTEEQVKLLASTYSGKKIFLTGHTGFKGSWLLYWLYMLGADVRGYALEPNIPEGLYYVIKGDKLCESIIADIRDKQKLENAILNFKPDFVFHLAAQPLVRLSYEIPSETFTVNAIGTSHILDAIRILEKPCIAIMITTDKVYENKEWVYAYRENDRLGGFDPYSASKACAELVISSYRNSFFHPHFYAKHEKAVASVRAGNVIGGGDWAKDRLIPDIIKALVKNEPIKVRNVQAVRPWEHVLEPLSGYLLLGAKLLTDPMGFSDSWNFGPLAEDNKTVEEIVRYAVALWGHGKYEKYEVKDQPHEAGLLRLDVSKAINLLGWRPKWDSKEALTKTITWYKDFISGQEPGKGIEKDINSYTQIEI